MKIVIFACLLAGCASTSQQVDTARLKDLAQTQTQNGAICATIAGPYGTGKVVAANPQAGQSITVDATTCNISVTK